ncbi:MAG: kelch repeat-containing protein, partial [Bacteroidota bacterium]|nr:kelch repeat-containing protein [Bacteroidota bacterium]
MHYKTSIISLIVLSLSVNTLFSQSTNWPVPRQGHSMVVIDSLIYIFGGQGNEDGILKAMKAGPQLNDVWIFNEDNEYEEEVPYDPPPRRHNHGVCGQEKDFFIFGGSGEEGIINDMYYFWPSANSWGEVRMNIEERYYTPRSDHTVNA